MKIPSIAEIEISEKRLFMRVDLDLPVNNDGQILDTYKIKLILPTINYALSQNARVILASHFGSPSGKFNKRYSLETVGGVLSEMLGKDIFFPDNSIGEAVRKIWTDMMPGQLMLLENLDFQKGELENSSEYSKILAEYADIYVNEAFSLANQSRASLLSICEHVEKICVGFQFKKELEALDKIKNPERPFTIMLGGSNLTEKIELLESMVDVLDEVVVGGVLANTLLSILGGEYGQSEIDNTSIYRIKRFLSSAEKRKINIVLPQDFVTIRGKLNNHSGSIIISGGRIPKDLMVTDIGPESCVTFAKRLSKAKTVLWTGPMGVCEYSEFARGTEFLAEALAASDVFSVIVGRDTVEKSHNKTAKGTRCFLSSGDKASMDYILGKHLASIEAMWSKIK